MLVCLCLTICMLCVDFCEISIHQGAKHTHTNTHPHTLWHCTQNWCDNLPQSPLKSSSWTLRLCQSLLEPFVCSKFKQKLLTNFVDCEFRDPCGWFINMKLANVIKERGENYGKCGQSLDLFGRQCQWQSLTKINGINNTFVSTHTHTPDTCMVVNAISRQKRRC